MQPPARPSAPAAGRSPIEAAERLLGIIDGVLRGTERAARALAGHGPTIDLAGSPDRRAQAEAFMRARRTALETAARVRKQVELTQQASGPVARLKAAGLIEVANLEAAAGALAARARVLAADPQVRPLLGAFAPAPGATPQARTAPPPPGASVQGAFARAATGARNLMASIARAAELPAEASATVPPPPPSPTGQPQAPGPAATTENPLAKTASAIAPLYRYTACRMPLLAGGAAIRKGAQPPADLPAGCETIVQAIAAVYEDFPAAFTVAHQAQQQVAELRRGMLAAQQGDQAVTPQRLRGLAVPLTAFPRRFAPFPVIKDVFPPVGM